MPVKKKHSVKANLQIFNLSKAGTSLELEVFEQKTKTKRRACPPKRSQTSHSTITPTPRTHLPSMKTIMA